MKILVTAPFEKANLDSLARDFDVTYHSWFDTRKIMSGRVLGDYIRQEGFDIFVTEEDELDYEALNACGRLQMVCVCRGTPSNINLTIAREKGIVVTNTPGRNAVGVAELVVGMMLDISRAMSYGDRMIRKGKWQEDYYFLSFREELFGKTCGFVGFGAVAQETAARLAPFAMKMMAYDPYVNHARAEELGVKLVDSLELLMQKSDFVTNHLPVTKETTGLLNAHFLRLMKPTAYFINTARAKTTNEDDLIALLKEGKISGAALDVFGQEPLPSDNPYVLLENVVLLPHLGGSTFGAIERHSNMVEEDIRAFVSGKKVLRQVGI